MKVIIDFKKGKPKTSGEYLAISEAGTYHTLPFSERHNQFNCRDNFTAEEVAKDEEYKVQYWAELPKLWKAQPITIGLRNYSFDELERIIDDEDLILETVELHRCDGCGAIYSKEDFSPDEHDDYWVGEAWQEENLCVDCFSEYVKEQTD